MALEINTITRLRRLFSWEESREDLLLEHKLVDLYSHLREWEEENAPRMSVGFEERVMEHLREIEIDSPTWKDKIIPRFLENRPVQYGLTIAMASILAVVMITRSQSNQTEVMMDTASVIINNTSYLDRPSSVEYADSFHRRVLIDSIRQETQSVDVLTKLETYYRATGKNAVASEIRYFIEEVNR